MVPLHGLPMSFNFILLFHPISNPELLTAAVSFSVPDTVTASVSSGTDMLLPHIHCTRCCGTEIASDHTVESAETCQTKNFYTHYIVLCSVWISLQSVSLLMVQSHSITICVFIYRKIRWTICRLPSDNKAERTTDQHKHAMNLLLNPEQVSVVTKPRPSARWFSHQYQA